MPRNCLSPSPTEFLLSLIVACCAFVLPVAGQMTFDVDDTTPAIHPTSGGSWLSISGTSFVTGMTVRIGTTEVEELDVLSAQFMRCRMPTKSEGTYDMSVVHPEGGSLTVQQAVQFAPLRLPPLEGLMCNVTPGLGGEYAILDWGNPIAYDRITVQRNDDPPVELSGYANRYIDLLVEPDGDVYTLVGYLGEIPSLPATCLAFPPDCPDQFVPILNPEASPVLATLHGGRADSVYFVFIPSTEAPRGIRIEVLSSRVGDGTLMARIFDPVDGGVMREDIPIAPPPGVYAIEPSRRVGEADIRLLEPSVGQEFVVELYVEGGSPDVPSFRIARQDLENEVVDPFQTRYYTHHPELLPETAEEAPPPTPASPPMNLLVKVYPIFPSPSLRVDRVDIEIRHPEGTPFQTWVPQALNFTAVLTNDFSEAPADRFGHTFFWNFGDGQYAVSASPTISHDFGTPGNYLVRLEVTDFNCREIEYEFPVVCSHFTDSLPAEYPEISRFTPTDPNILSIPEGAEYTGTFPSIPVRFMVTPAADATVQRVEASLLAGYQQILTRNANPVDPQDPNPATYWGFDLTLTGTYPQSYLTLRVTAVDSQERETTEDFYIGVCHVPSFLSFPGMYEPIQVMYNSTYQFYVVAFLIDRSLTTLYSWSLDIPTPYGNFPINTAVKATVLGSLVLQDTKWSVYSMKGYINGKFMDAWVPLVQYELPPNAFGQQDFQCGYFTFFTPVEQQSVKYEVYLGPQEFSQLDLFGQLTDISGAVNLVLDGSWDLFNFDAWPSDNHMRLDVAADGWIAVHGEYEAGNDGEFANGAIYASAFATADAEYHFLSDSDGTTTETSQCTRIEAYVDAGGCIFWGLGCESDSLSFTSALGRCETTESMQQEVGLKSLRRPKSQASGDRLLNPEIAVSPDGQLTLMVSQKDTSTQGGYEPDLFFSTGQTSDLSEPQRIWNDDFVRRDPHVAFLSDSQAICVWAQSRYTRAKLHALTESGRLTTELRNVLLASGEIGYAFWDHHAGWGPPMTLTDDGYPDGKPRVAADLINGEAQVAWERAETGEYYTSESEPQPELKVIGYATIDTQGRVTANGLVTPRDRTTVDHSPCIAVSAGGDAVWLVWIRDFDGDIATPADRDIVYSTLDRDTWSAPVPLSSARILAPIAPRLSLADAENGLLTYMQPLIPESGEISGDSTACGVYVTPLKHNTFQDPRPIFHVPEPGRLSPRPALGRFPEPVLLPSGNFAVVYREFGSPGSAPFAGDLAVAVVDIGPTMPKVSFARRITDDEEDDIELASAVTGTELLTVRRSSLAVARGREFSLSRTPLEVDTSIAAFYVSNPHALPGETVNAVIELWNSGLVDVVPPFEVPPQGGPPEPAPNVTARITLDRMDGSHPAIVSETRQIFSAGPDGILRILLPVVVPAGTASLKAEAWVDSETQLTDNLATGSPGTQFGVRPPTNLLCGTPEGSQGVQVTVAWDNGEAYDSVYVYRDGRLQNILPGQATSYADDTVTLGLHSWSVLGEVRGRRSAAIQYFLDVDGLPRDTDGDGSIDVLDPDADNDGLPDTDEDLNQDGLWGAGETSWLLPDTDRDGVNDGDERKAGTDPLDRRSLLRIVDLLRTSRGTTITWQGGENVTQQLQGSGDASPTNSDWQTLDTRQPPTTITNSFTDSDSAEGKKYYRIAVPE